MTRNRENCVESMTCGLWPFDEFCHVLLPPLYTYGRALPMHSVSFYIEMFKKQLCFAQCTVLQKRFKNFFFLIFQFFLCTKSYDRFFFFFIQIRNTLSKWQMLENATSAQGEFWESVFLKHSSILSLGLVPAALVLWTVWTCASGKHFPRILPVRKSDISAL